MEVKIEQSWANLLTGEFEKQYFQKLAGFVKGEYKNKTIYPPAANIFAAFNACPVNKIKAVIVGQDPYHGPDQAMGLSFSVPRGVALPPSLQNIYKELKTDLGIDRGVNGDLSDWAAQGVLLLNATLTVNAGLAGSHQGRGWEQFTDSVINLLSQTQNNIAYILWGSYAQKKGASIDESKNLVIKSPHPSPLSSYRGFFGSKPFSSANEYLKSVGKSEIKWG